MSDLYGLCSMDNTHERAQKGYNRVLRSSKEILFKIGEVDVSAIHEYPAARLLAAVYFKPKSSELVVGLKKNDLVKVL